MSHIGTYLPITKGGLGNSTGSAASLNNIPGAQITGTVPAATLPLATGGTRGALIVGTNLTNTAGTLSLTAGNITAALTFTPEDAAEKNAASGYAGLDASSLLTPAQIPFATGAVRGGVITGSNITNTGGTISLTNTNVTTALGYTPLNKAGDTMTAGFLTLFQDGTSAMHAVTKQQLDAVVTGLDVKASVRVATAAALPAYSRTGNVITASANGVLTVDGVTVALNDRILVKDGAAGADNGIYSVTTLGTAGVPYVLTRTTDADNSPAGEVTAGMFTFVTEGTANADTGWVLSTNDTITLNTTALTFMQFSSAGVITVSGTSALTKTGNALSVNVDNSSIEIATNNLQVKALGITNAMLAGSIADGKLSANVALYNGTTAFSAKQTFFTSTTGAASILIPHGVAPTTPTNGDVWTTTAGLFVRVNGVTVGPLSASTGTVTSVALSLPSFITVSGSPVTTTGTLTGTLASQTANTAFLAPNGAAGAPTFRAIVAADLPTATGAALGVAQAGAGLTAAAGVFSVNFASATRTVRVVTAAGAITVVTTDDIVIVNKTTGAASAVSLPAAPATGESYTIKDGKGDAATNNITISPAAGNIDGGGTYVMDGPYQATTFIYNGTEWNVI